MSEMGNESRFLGYGWMWVGMAYPITMGIGLGHVGVGILGRLGWYKLHIKSSSLCS